MNTIIETIRAEVNRLWNEHPTEDIWDRGYNYACEEIMSFLSDLEKEEKPMNPQPVKIDIRKELASIEFMGVNDARDTETIARHFYELGKQSKPKVSEGLDDEIYKEKAKVALAFGGVTSKQDKALIDFARHFAQWGAEHASGSSEIPNDLESYAQTVEDYYDVGEERGYLCTHREDIKNAVIAGSKWQKEQMMKDCVHKVNQAYFRGIDVGKAKQKDLMMKEALEKAYFEEE